MKHFFTFALCLATASLAAAAPAHADSTCPALMAGHFDWDSNGPANLVRFQNFTYVYIVDGGAWTQWSSGPLFWNGRVGGTDLLQTVTPLAQLFSDRKSGSQPFFIGAADSTTITGISRDGTITMHNNTWNFDSTFNATCFGHTLLAHSGNDTLIFTINDTSSPR